MLVERGDDVVLFPGRVGAGGNEDVTTPSSLSERVGKVAMGAEFSRQPAWVALMRLAVGGSRARCGLCDRRHRQGAGGSGDRGRHRLSPADAAQARHDGSQGLRLRRQATARPPLRPLPGPRRCRLPVPDRGCHSEHRENHPGPGPKANPKGGLGQDAPRDLKPDRPNRLPKPRPRRKSTGFASSLRPPAAALWRQDRTGGWDWPQNSSASPWTPCAATPDSAGTRSSSRMRLAQISS